MTNDLEGLDGSVDKIMHKPIVPSSARVTFESVRCFHVDIAQTPHYLFIKRLLRFDSTDSRQGSSSTYL